MQLSHVAFGLWLGCLFWHAILTWLQSAPYVQQYGFPFLLAMLSACPQLPVLQVLPVLPARAALATLGGWW